VLIVAVLGWLFDAMDQRLFILARTPALRDLLPASAAGQLPAFAGWATGLFTPELVRGSLLAQRQSELAGVVTRDKGVNVSMTGLDLERLARASAATETEAVRPCCLAGPIKGRYTPMNYGYRFRNGRKGV
jgi:hypothetical protein